VADEQAGESAAEQEAGRTDRRRQLGTELTSSIERVRSISRRLRLAITMLLLVLVVGTLGYMVIEGWGAGDSLYMTIITVTTVGYGETHTLHWGGRVFTGFLLFGGLGLLLYVLSAVIEVLIEAQVSGLVGRRRMEREIEQMHDHFIICGYGRIGQTVAEQLRQEGQQIVVLDSNAEAAELARLRKLPVITGDATSDALLVQAGIKRARCLLSTADSDATNLFIIVSARALNSRTQIIARVSSFTNAGKLRRAGANHVISPYELGGLRMATLATRPAVASYLDTLLHDESNDFNLGEVGVVVSGRLGDLLALVEQRPAVLAVHKPDNVIPNPPTDTQVAAGDRLIVVGTSSQLRALDEALGDGQHSKGEWRHTLESGGAE